MTSTPKTGAARRAIAPAIALAAAVALPITGLALTAATPALAKEQSFLPSAAPMAAVAAAGSVGESLASASDMGTSDFEVIGDGMASYYGRELAGNRTASGERFDPSKLTAAHRTLPLGTNVRVTNQRTGESVMVRINDRGPFHGNRIIDLSEAAASEIGIRAAGRGMVELAVEAD
ncbi:septal ring lytic transglycosylase RlpA family protein [Novosphingobium sp. M1R2S20]|uniref:Endolytic peptidoglycan transglycosylase RlpA n=1 Tax=Novosphingobium rhizovicinum TaxID=3228928 RepID=A0ABV3RFB4_9SPHN